MPCLSAGRFSGTLGNCLEFALFARIKRQQTVCFVPIAAAYDNGLNAVKPVCSCHVTRFSLFQNDPMVSLACFSRRKNVARAFGLGESLNDPQHYTTEEGRGQSDVVE
jgi:hypothetical protein